MNSHNSRESGAALLSVLLLVAVMAVIAAIMLDRLNLATRLAGNGQAMTQARLYATSAETLAMARIKAMVDVSDERTVDRGGLLGREFPLPLARGTVMARVDDAGNCFNINSLIEADALGTLKLRVVGLNQLRALMAGLAIPQAESAIASDAIADWIDSDNVPAPNGAEDETYQGTTTPYRTAGRLIGDVSEIRAVRGMTPQFYERLRPWLCALPGADLSPINVNTLRPDQALLLSILAPEAIPVDRARALIAARPALGWGSADDALRGLSAPNIPLNQLQVRSRWFLLTQTVTVDSAQVEEQALIDVGSNPPRVAFRSWGDRFGR
ncbi:type II secretion system minor pseudopilin GspK [Novosphingobium sp. MMS21-SN21R]|uniref:type II secretion system minor pseudopilin GspK n=1 Tax=Novosphingobium sp. MMS21-SN21R TaxID=2969298 RepID=UPI002888C704|nr:type II secretion system minor pseudopilin GspK [Novosphingobium sp. MMS21-SN21R]MDT0507579.1 type II secretion system minor pseudopilin GspK [Novosphingobium sp. MMS21-SN21R]